MADWSLHLCVITAALCICMPALEGDDEKCAPFYNHKQLRMLHVLYTYATSISKQIHGMKFPLDTILTEKV